MTNRSFILLVTVTLFGITHGIPSDFGNRHITAIKASILQRLGYDDFSRYDIVWPQHSLPSRHSRSSAPYGGRNLVLAMDLFGDKMAAFLLPQNLTSGHFSSMQWTSLSDGVSTEDESLSDVDWQCHYRGRVELCRNGVCMEGRTAFSNCDDQGLRGFVMVADDAVDIRPLPRLIWSLIREAIGGYLAIKLEPTRMFDGFHPLADKDADILHRSTVERHRLFPSTWPFVLSATGNAYRFRLHDPLSAVPTSADVDFTDDDLLLEIAVFIDQAMTSKLKKDHPRSKDRINVVLSAFNAVQVLYDDPSFGNVHVRISVKKLVFDKTGTADIKGDGQSESYLYDFCERFQGQMGNRDDWDIAIALTGLDIYGVLADINTDTVYAGLKFKEGRVYGVTGLSFTGGLCRNKRNCVLAEFSKGLGNVDTIAHEIGHVLGMNHDGAAGNSCDSAAGKIMSLSSAKPRQGWSACSVESFTDLLRQGKGDCLAHIAPESVI
ncbi:putative A disintegrin and metalloproteinase with thrombospondin motifs 6 [Hypsibius exemplaris]|uniref:A disintegrin and metalloproteinase with thrombospondin motifs 6 n=1 Tax=Hypsibius exemplaris TaxID=2072580 RepID=A0A1W0WGB4_HYPEX|nr:putative A disintegrin and metalloproteinase with thrombospondin motifs 6 [Hypsibius exemplaris]